MSFLQSVSAYWQALLNALEGNAMDCCLDLAADIIQERFGSLMTPDVARGNTQRLAARFGVEGEQFVHPRHNRSCNRVSWIELHRLEKLSSSMSPTRGIYHSRPADLIVSCVAVSLQNAFELSQEPLRSIASAA